MTILQYCCLWHIIIFSIMIIINFCLRHLYRISAFLLNVATKILQDENILLNDNEITYSVNDACWYTAIEYNRILTIILNYGLHLLKDQLYCYQIVIAVR